ncbi:MAG: cytochrome c biogenesis protein ResB [Gammaproteobacteria bacterium]
MSSETLGRVGKPRTTLSILLEFLGSMNLAITLLGAVGIASVVGTVLKQDQPYSDYLLKFGPFWHEVFKNLGLYDVYSSGWFLFILGFLLVSTSVCILRNGPTMLREMRQYRLNVQEKSLRAMGNTRTERLQDSADDVAQRTAKLLQNYGYSVRTKDHGDHRVLAAMKGRFNRLGYIFAHLAIVVICIGGLMDSKMFLKMAIMDGSLKVETQDLPVSKVPKSSIIGTGNFSFRGEVNVPEGSDANVIFLNVKDGYVVQRLPFDIYLKKFRIEHYMTGQPKSFESDIIIRDPKHLKEPLATTIKVNHPLIYRGYAIYQSSFGDGGSFLDMKLWPLDTHDAKPEILKGNVFGKYPLKTSAGPLNLELTNFRLYNIEPAPDSTPKHHKFHNLGPSFTFKLRRPDGQAREYKNYMVPVTENGHPYFLSGMRATPAEPFRYLHIPADPNGTPKRFMTFLSYLQNPAEVKKVVEKTTAEAMTGAKINNRQLSGQVAKSMEHLVALFTSGGYEAVANEVDAKVPEARKQEALDAFLKVLSAALEAVYTQMMHDQGVKQLTQDDWRFYNDAVTAINLLPYYGTPVYIQLTNFKQVQASGLQVTKAPGKDVVYFGSVLLVMGVFLLFFMPHRRIWLWLRPEEDGGSEATLAGTSNKNVLEFKNQFAALAEKLFSGLRRR